MFGSCVKARPSFQGRSRRPAAGARQPAAQHRSCTSPAYALEEAQEVGVGQHVAALVAPRLHELEQPDGHVWGGGIRKVG